jgi:hypothetical protein
MPGARSRPSDHPFIPGHSILILSLSLSLSLSPLPQPPPAWRRMNNDVGDVVIAKVTNL